MQSLKFTRTNGNIPKKLAGEDHVSGLVIYSAALPSGFSESERIKAVSTIETAEALGITADADNWDIRVLHYQLSEIFRINPGISLYVGIFTSPEGANTYAEVKKMQKTSPTADSGSSAYGTDAHPSRPTTSRPCKGSLRRSKSRICRWASSTLRRSRPWRRCRAISRVTRSAYGR